VVSQILHCCESLEVLREFSGHSVSLSSPKSAYLLGTLPSDFERPDLGRGARRLSPLVEYLLSTEPWRRLLEWREGLLEDIALTIKVAPRTNATVPVGEPRKSLRVEDWLRARRPVRAELRSFPPSVSLVEV